MKKTLITLAALSMVSLATAATNVIPSDKQTITTGLGEDGVISVNDKSWGLMLTSAWTLQFDAVITETNKTGSSSYYDIVQIGHSNGTNLFKLWFNADTNELGFDRSGGSVQVTANLETVGTAIVNDKKTHAYTIVSSGGNAPTLTLYIDGATTATSSRPFHFNAEVDTWAINKVEFGGATNTTKIALDVSNVNLSAIPEPATATLSLLALAGLAARRRRK